MEVIGMIFIYSLVGFVVILVAKWLYRRLRNSLKYTFPPGPKGWPLIGNTFNLSLNNLHISVWDHMDKFGDMSYVNIGGIDIVFVNSFDAFHNVLGHPAYKRKLCGRMDTFLSQYYVPDDLILGTYNDKWAKLRKLVHSIVTTYSRDVNDIEGVINEEFRIMKKRLELMDDKTPFDISSWIYRSTGNVMITLLVGERFDYDHDIHKLLLNANNQIDDLSCNFNNAVLTTFPLLRFAPFGPGKVFQGIKKNLRLVFQYLRQRVDEKLNRRGILYDILYKQGELGWLNDGNVHGVFVDVIMGGVGTTSRTIYIMILILLHKEEVQKRIQDEIDTVLGRDRDPSLTDKANMPYTRASILELLRYAPFIPFVGAHTAIEDCDVEGFHIKKDTSFMANLWRMNHDQNTWTEPWEFKPERYLDDDGNLLPPEHQVRKNMSMFGVGIRRCVGEMFALNRLFLFFAHMCQRFTFIPDDAESLPSMDPRDWQCKTFIMPRPYKLRLEVRT